MEPNFTNSDLWCWAKKYYDLGLTPLPAIPLSKKLAVAWKNFSERPSWEEIEKLFEQAFKKYSNINISVLCGKKHNLLVLDIDDCEKWIEICNSAGVNPEPPGVKVRSPHGLHYLFRYPKDLDVARVVIKENRRIIAELRGTGCSVVMPPSQLKDGKYEFAEPDSLGDLPDFPANLWSFVQSLAAEETTGSSYQSGEYSRSCAYSSEPHPEPDFKELLER